MFQLWPTAPPPITEAQRQDLLTNFRQHGIALLVEGCAYHNGVISDKHDLKESKAITQKAKRALVQLFEPSHTAPDVALKVTVGLLGLLAGGDPTSGSSSEQRTSLKFYDLHANGVASIPPRKASDSNCLSSDLPYDFDDRLSNLLCPSSVQP